MVRCQGKTQTGGRCRRHACPGCKNCPYHKGQRRGGSSCNKKRRQSAGAFGWGKVAKEEKEAAKRLREQAKVAKNQAKMFEKARRKQIAKKIGQDLGEIKSGVQQKAKLGFEKAKRGAEWIGRKAEAIDKKLGALDRNIERRFREGKETIVTKNEQMKIKAYANELAKLGSDLAYIKKKMTQKDAEVRRLCAKPRHKQLTACYNYLNQTL